MRVGSIVLFHTLAHVHIELGQTAWFSVNINPAEDTVQPAMYLTACTHNVCVCVCVCNENAANLLCCRLFAADRCATAASPSSSPTPVGAQCASDVPPSMCSRCRAPLSPGQLVMRARQFVYHVDCFACSICGRRLRTGQQYALTTTTTTTATPCGGSGSSLVVPFIYCRDDYEHFLLGDTCPDQGLRGSGVERSLPAAAAGRRHQSSPMAIKGGFDECVQQQQLQRHVVESPTPTTKGRQRKRRTTSNPVTATVRTAAAAATAGEVDTGNMFKMVVNKRKSVDLKCT